MSSNVLKQVETSGENEAVPFREWIAEHANRIPHQTVRIPDEAQDEHSPPGYSYREVIEGKKTRVASRHVSVSMLRESALHVGASAPGETEEDDGEFPFGLTEEQYNELHETWEEDKREEIHRAVESARSEAYEEGYETAAAEAEKEIRELTGILTDAVASIEAQWTEFLEANEPMLGKLAFDIAERILDAPLPEEVYEGVTAAIHDAVDELSGETRTDITIHPADFIRLKETGLLEQLESVYESLHWHSDPELEQRGDWIVETPKAAVRHLQDELLEDVERTLELP